MRSEDFRINAIVRSILVRRYIDTSRCIFTTINGRVYIRGELLKIYRKRDREDNGGNLTQSEATSEKASGGFQPKQGEVQDGELLLISILEQEISRIPAVKGIQFDLRNWRKEMGKWVRRTH